MIDTETTPGLTPTRRRVALIALLVVVFLFAAWPTKLRVDDGRIASCGLTTYVFGGDDPAVTEACRNAFDGRAAAALILLGGIALLAAEFVPKRGTAGDEPVSPPKHPPGDDPSLLGGLRKASVDPSFRILAGLGIALLVVLGVVLRPLELQASVLGEERTVGCGFRDYLFGADEGAVTATCREAYASRAAGGLIVLLGLGISVAMMAWIVQYHRGAALGSVWHRSGVPTRLLARTGGACAILAVVALLAAAQGASPATSGRGLASAPASALDGPVGDELTPQPTFAAFSPMVLPPLTATGPSGAASTVGSFTASTSTAPSEEPLTVRDASWYAANPGPLYAATVPEGSLPVGATGGEDDLHAFFRVSGTARTLTLVESDALGSQWLAERAQIAACPVTAAGWKQTSGGDFDDQPPFDDIACVDAARADDGTWTIDLGGFEGRGGNRGFALIPAPDAGGRTFRVTFLPPEARSTMSTHDDERRSRHA